MTTAPRAEIFFAPFKSNGIWQIPAQAQSSPNNHRTNELLKQADFYIESNQFLAAQTKLEEALRLYRVSKDTNGQIEALIDWRSFWHSADSK